MDDKPVQDEPSDVEAGENAVHVQGPADVDVSMTPRAALETARRLGEAAVESIINYATDDKTPPDPETAPDPTPSPQTD